MTFWKKVDINEGKKNDVHNIAGDLTSEQLEQLKKKNSKLIDIYKGQDGNANDLSTLDIALAMDGFINAAGKDGKLSDKEIEEYLKKNNINEGRSKKDEIKAKDIRKFIESYSKITKKSETVGVDKVISVDGESKNLGLTRVEGENNLYYNDRFNLYVQYDKEKDDFFPVKIVDGKAVKMTRDEAEAKYEETFHKEFLADADASKPEDYVRVDDKNAVYKDANGKLYQAADDEEKGTIKFVRVKANGSNGYKQMGAEEIAATDGKYTKQADGTYLKDGNMYVYKDGRMSRAHYSNGKPVVMTEREIENSKPSSYTIQLTDSYDKLIIKSLKGQHIDDPDYVPTKEEIEQAKAQFEAANPKAVGTKNGRKFIKASAVVQIPGGLEDLKNSAQVKQQYREAVKNRDVKRDETAKQKAVEEGGYKSAGAPDLYTDGSEPPKYYRWDKEKGELVEAEDVTALEDGKFEVNEKLGDDVEKHTTYDKDGKPELVQVQAGDNLTEQEQTAESLGFDKTMATESSGIYVDRNTGIHYKWNDDYKGFIPLPSIEMVGPNGNVYDENGKHYYPDGSVGQLHKDGSETITTKDGKKSTNEYDSKTGLPSKSSVYDKDGNLTETKEYKYEGSVQKEVVTTKYDADGETVVSKSIRGFNSEGKDVEIIQNADGVNTEKVEYNKDGKEIERTFYKPDGKHIKGIAKTTYNKDGSRIVVLWNANRTTQLEQTNYDKDGNVTYHHKRSDYKG